jgi:hypothetical protein
LLVTFFLLPTAYAVLERRKERTAGKGRRAADVEPIASREAVNIRT